MLKYPRDFPLICVISISAKNTYGYEICPKCLNTHEISPSFASFPPKIQTDMKFAGNALLFYTRQSGKA